MTSAIPVRCSTNWATKPHIGSEVKIWTQLIDLTPNVWVRSSVGRASHRYRGGHGFESRWSPDFFQASSFQLLKIGKLTATIILHFHLYSWSTIRILLLLHKEFTNSLPPSLFTWQPCQHCPFISLQIGFILSTGSKIIVALCHYESFVSIKMLSYQIP